jgi:hypothetical protein
VKASEIFFAGDEEFDVRHSDWIHAGDDLAAMHAEFHADYQAMVESLTEELGEPLEQRSDGPGRLEDLNFGLLCYAIFKYGDDQYVIGYGQQDNETPIFIITRQLGEAYQVAEAEV